MRFIRREHLITTIFNKELTEESEIKTVFDNLYKHRIEFSMIMKKYMPQNYDYLTMNFDKIKIKKVYDDDNTFDCINFKKGTKTHMKKIPFSDIVEINATTTKHKVLDVDSDVTRFDLLDL